METRAIIEALQKRHAQVEGIASAPTRYPEQIGDTPCCILWPGAYSAFEDSYLGGADFEEGVDENAARAFMGEVYINEAGVGTYEDNVQTALDLMDRVAKLYRSMATLDTIDSGEPQDGQAGRTAPVEGCRVMMTQARPYQDTGFRELKYTPDGPMFEGFRFTVWVFCGYDS